jgi:hypothetical protein
MPFSVALARVRDETRALFLSRSFPSWPSEKSNGQFGILVIPFDKFNRVPLGYTVSMAIRVPYDLEL